MFIFGEKLFGKIYQVPGVCYVATIFFHIWFVPLGPSRTYIVLIGSEYPHIPTTSFGFRGVRIPLSARSIAMCYGRILLGFFLLVVVSGLAVELIMPPELNLSKTRPSKWATIVFPSAMGIAAILLFLLSYRLNAASESKRIELDKQLCEAESAQALKKKIQGTQDANTASKRPDREPPRRI